MSFFYTKTLNVKGFLSMISASKLELRAMCLQRSIASVVALAIQKRHFVDHLLVWRQVDGRSGVFCCAVRILLLIIVRLHQFSDNVLFLSFIKSRFKKRDFKSFFNLKIHFEKQKNTIASTSNRIFLVATAVPKCRF